MAQFEGYDEDALREQKRADAEARRKRSRGEVEWNNVEGEVVRLVCRKPKLYWKLMKRIEKEGPIFGLQYAGSDFKIEKNGTTYVYNEYTDTVKGYQNYKESVSYIDVVRTFVLKDQRLIDNCKEWFKLLYKAPKAPVLWWILAACGPIAAISSSAAFAEGGTGAGVATIVIGVLMTVFFGFLAIKGSKKFNNAKNIVKSSKNIWKQLKADSK